jgi:hypothetical protein
VFTGWNREVPDAGNRGHSRKRSRLERQEEKQTQAAARQEQKKLKKQIQKQQIKRDYAKAKRSEQTVGTATKGTIDYIKKIGGKVTNFFKENRKVYISVAVLIGLIDVSDHNECHVMLCSVFTKCDHLHRNQLSVIGSGNPGSGTVLHTAGS